MASSRLTRPTTSESVSTYGGEARGYTSLQTWEDATDIDLVTATQCAVLECYDDAASFDDCVVIAGATVNATYFRVIRAASGQGHDGTPNNGITINYTSTATNGTIDSDEAYFQLQDLIIITTGNNASVVTSVNVSGASSAVIGCIYKTTNSGAGSGMGIIAGGNLTVVVNCLAYECKTDGQRIAATAGITNYMYNCTSVGNTVNGFRANDQTGTIVLTNCLATENGVDFLRATATGTLTVTYCCSLDNTADDWAGAGNLIGKTITYTNAAGDDWHTNDSDINGMGIDLSADAAFPFNDDIDSNTRDASDWQIGMDDNITVSDTAADGLSMGDSDITRQDFRPIVSDGAVFGETNQALASLFALIADGAIFGDVPNWSATIDATVSDGIKLGDSSGRILATIGIAADGIKLGDSDTITVTLIASIADGVKFSEAVNPLLQLLASVADGANFGDVTIEAGSLAVGLFKITFSVKQADIVFASKAPDMAFASKAADVAFSGSGG